MFFYEDKLIKLSWASVCWSHPQTRYVCIDSEGIVYATKTMPLPAGDKWVGIDMIPIALAETQNNLTLFIRPTDEELLEMIRSRLGI